MDVGLYNAKWGFRKMISFVLPAVKNVSPDAVSWSLLPVGLVTAAVYYFAVSSGPTWLYLVGIVLVFVRMFLGTLDGLMATEFDKATPLGAVVNRVAPELCDVMYLLAIPIAAPGLRLVGLGALAAAWLVTFSGLVGATSGLVTQSVGPVGQTDRIAALMLFSLLAFVGPLFGWDVAFIWWFLVWVIAGSALTVLLRLQRTFKGLTSAA